jgi:hypothetical protein
MEALIAQLRGSSYVFEYRTDYLGRLTALFFRHSFSIELFKQFPYVLLLDCMYKTNKFKMPLLNIVGTTSLNSTFHIIFSFLFKETEEDYIWALHQLKGLYINHMKTEVMIMDHDIALMNALHIEFPFVVCHLCIWHVEENVLKHASEYFTETQDSTTFVQTFTTVLNSNTLAVYKECWNDFQD